MPTLNNAMTVIKPSHGRAPEIDSGKCVKLDEKRPDKGLPVPCSQKGKKQQKKVDRIEVLELFKCEDDPDEVLVDEGYKKHLKQHANNEIDTPLPCLNENPWDAEADKSLPIGLLKHDVDLVSSVTDSNFVKPKDNEIQKLSNNQDDEAKEKEAMTANSKISNTSKQDETHLSVEVVEDYADSNATDKQVTTERDESQQGGMASTTKNKKDWMRVETKQKKDIVPVPTIPSLARFLPTKRWLVKVFEYILTASCVCWVSTFFVNPVVAYPVDTGVEDLAGLLNMDGYVFLTNQSANGFLGAQQMCLGNGAQMLTNLTGNQIASLHKKLEGTRFDVWMLPEKDNRCRFVSVRATEDDYLEYASCNRNGIFGLCFMPPYATDTPVYPINYTEPSSSSIPMTTATTPYGSHNNRTLRPRVKCDTKNLVVRIYSRFLRLNCSVAGDVESSGVYFYPEFAAGYNETTRPKYRVFISSESEEVDYRKYTYELVKGGRSKYMIFELAMVFPQDLRTFYFEATNKMGTTTDEITLERDPGQVFDGGITTSASLLSLVAMTLAALLLS